ncbi:Aminomethyltransferase folate-binding domain-containing protein [Auriscalpium vulgare]|uniref:Aminomethyltransferase folate-binding domain-containing protein n=1 Tax=Auriscalpium vulgare TaxID=40419 RepID=A0ACB8RZP6_9AGAM|nr:Aminomethyltransferase folate-binding domain-containing protein [Auriscalpium vulgare]
MPTPHSVRPLLRATPTYTRLPRRGLISVSGSHAASFLNGVLASSVPANPGAPFFTAFLNAQGRVIYDAFVHTHDAPSTSSAPAPSYIIEYDASPSPTPDTPPLLAMLKRYVLRAKVRLRDVTEEHDVYASWNPQAPLEERRWIWSRSGVVEPVWGHSTDGVGAWGVEGDGVRVLRDRRAVGMGLRRIVRKGDQPPEASTHDVGTADDYLVHRIVHGVPEGVRDIPPLTAFPMDSNLDIMGALDFRKGCYTGQELTVRTYHTGIIRKRILPVIVHPSSHTPSSSLNPSGPTPTEPPKQLGTDVRASLTHAPPEGRIARPRGTGRLLSHARGVGLALLRLEHVEGVESGDLRLALDDQGSAGWGVTPWWANGWPTRPEDAKEP